MELLELKSIWDLAVQDTITRHSVDEFVVTKSIRRDSKTVLAKIKRVMYLKFVVGGLTLVLSIMMLVGSYVSPDQFTFFESIFNLMENRIFLINMMVFIGGLLTANYLAFREIGNFNNGTDIRSSLKRFVRIMQRTIKLNIYSGATFNAALITWIIYATAFRSEPFSWNTKALIVALAPFVSFIGMYFIGRYEQKLKFGNYLKSLKENLRSLEKEKFEKV